MSTPKRLEFFYDFSCPYAYLASTQIEALAARTGAELVYAPFLLGGVFRALGPTAGGMEKLPPVRARMNGLDMHRWAEHWNVPLVMPATHPNRTVTALRATLASGDVRRASQALFRAYWLEGRDVSDPDVVRAALDGAGLDGAAALAGAEQQKDELFRRTAEAVERGVFGAPACFVDGVLYWGQDRLDFVERALGGAAPRPSPARSEAPRDLDFWFDFSSPFAYLASTQMPELGARTGAKVRWQPFLLGALFRAVGTADVPLFSFSEPKRRWFGEDMQRFARHYAVPFRFPSRFPLRSVRPLRAVLAAAGDGERFARAVFHAAWAEDRDVESPEVLKEIARELGLDPGLVDAAETDGVKAMLRAQTERAVELGLPGAPSFVVGDHVFWGQDRLAFVEKAISGWRPRVG